MLRMMRILSPIDPLRSATSTISIGAQPSSSTWLAERHQALEPVPGGASCVFCLHLHRHPDLVGGLTISNVSDMISRGVEVCECVVARKEGGARRCSRVRCLRLGKLDTPSVVARGGSEPQHGGAARAGREGRNRPFLSPLSGVRTSDAITHQPSTRCATPRSPSLTLSASLSPWSLRRHHLLRSQHALGRQSQPLARSRMPLSTRPSASSSAPRQTPCPRASRTRRRQAARVPGVPIRAKSAAESGVGAGASAPRKRMLTEPSRVDWRSIAALGISHVSTSAQPGRRERPWTVTVSGWAPWLATIVIVR